MHHVGSPEYQYPAAKLSLNNLTDQLSNHGNNNKLKKAKGALAAYSPFIPFCSVIFTAAPSVPPSVRIHRFAPEHIVDSESLQLLQETCNQTIRIALALLGTSVLKYLTYFTQGLQ